MKHGTTNKKSIFDSTITHEVFGSAKVLDTSECLHQKVADDVGKDRTVKHISKDLHKFRCSLCNSIFTDLGEQRAHFKTEWHAFNLKLKVSGRDPIGELVFQEQYKEGVDDNGLLDSSEEDYEDDEHEVKLGERKPKIDFVTSEKQSFAVFRCLLETDLSKENCVKCANFEDSLKNLCNESCWVVMMMSAGHFAAAVFHRNEVIAHKTIHRYVVRAKRGTSQSKRDGKQSGKSPRSAGAHIRRQNEIALVEEIQESLHKWKVHIDHSDRIFIQWPQDCRRILFGGKKPTLARDDTRIRKMPFQTGKPTYDELKRIYMELSTITLNDLPIAATEEKSAAGS